MEYQTGCGCCGYRVGARGERRILWSKRRIEWSKTTHLLIKYHINTENPAFAGFSLSNH